MCGPLFDLDGNGETDFLEFLTATSMDPDSPMHDIFEDEDDEYDDD